MTGKTGPLLAVLTMLVAFFSAIAPARATSDGLIAHWKLDESSGTTAADSKGGNDGTLLNGPVWQPTGGHIGGAIGFDGVDDEVNFGSGINLANNSFTLSTFVKRGTVTGDWDLFLWQGTGSSDEGLHLGFRPSSVFTCAFWGDDLDTSSSYTDENWHHWVCTYDAVTRERTIYRDGIAVANDTAASNYYGTGDMLIGETFSGSIDDVRIYNRALSAAEVLELYNTEYCAAPVRPEGVMFYNACCKTYQFCNGTDWINIGAKAPQCTNTSFASALVAQWKLDENSGTTAYDSIGSDNGTVDNTTWSWQPSGGKINGALYLSDGDDPHVSYASRDFGNQFTIALWINPRSDTGANLLANKISWDTANGFRLLLWDSTKAIFFDTGDPTDSLTDNAYSIDDVYAFDQWRHVAVTVDRTAGTARIYVDGTDRTSDSTIRTDFNTSGPWTLGTSTNVSSSFRGYMDDVRIYNRVLSAAEIGQLYNGMDWVTTGPDLDPCRCNPSPGDVCADGTVYAGLSPDGNTPMFVARCDAGQTWDGSACTGTRSGLSWNDGSTGYTDSGVVECYPVTSCAPTGESNTATLVTDDASTAGGFQDHAAAKYCSDLNAHGHSDWYLPSIPELTIAYDIFGNGKPYQSIGNFDIFSHYWSSSEEVNTSRTWDLYFDDGNRNNPLKDNTQNVRCVRK